MNYLVQNFNFSNFFFSFRRADFFKNYIFFFKVIVNNNLSHFVFYNFRFFLYFSRYIKFSNYIVKSYANLNWSKRFHKTSFFYLLYSRNCILKKNRIIMFNVLNLKKLPTFYLILINFNYLVTYYIRSFFLKKNYFFFINTKSSYIFDPFSLKFYLN